MLRFRVKHQPNIVQPRQTLGVAAMQISELLELGKDQQGEFKILVLYYSSNFNHDKMSY